jgi:hypothetical protein
VDTEGSAGSFISDRLPFGMLMPTYRALDGSAVRA